MIDHCFCNVLIRGLFCTDYMELMKLVGMRKTNCRDLRVARLRDTASFPYRLFCNNRRVLYRCGGRTSCVGRMAGRLTAIVLYRGPLPAAESTSSVLPSSRPSNFTLPEDSDTNAVAVADVAAADLLPQYAIYCPARQYRISPSENLTRNPPPSRMLPTSKYFTLSHQTFCPVVVCIQNNNVVICLSSRRKSVLSETLNNRKLPIIHEHVA